MLVLVSNMRFRSIPKICHNTNMNVASSEMKPSRLHASSEIRAIPLCPKARLWNSHLVGHPEGKQHAAMGQRRWHWPPGQLALGTGSVLIPLSGHSTSSRAETYANRDGTRQALEQTCRVPDKAGPSLTIHDNGRSGCERYCALTSSVQGPTQRDGRTREKPRAVGVGTGNGG